MMVGQIHFENGHKIIIDLIRPLKITFPCPNPLMNGINFGGIYPPSFITSPPHFVPSIYVAFCCVSLPPSPHSILPPFSTRTDAPEIPSIWATSLKHSFETMTFSQILINLMLFKVINYWNNLS